MTFIDNRGLDLSTSSAAAAQAYCSGADLLLSLWPGAAESLNRAIALDPDFALAHAALARQHAIHARLSQARSAIAQAEALVMLRGTERERSHVKTLALAIRGQSSQALAAATRHLGQWPRDVLIFGLPLGAFGLLAFSGMPDHDQARVALCERYAAHFSETDWWFLTYRGWSHAENGNVAYGRALTEQALELRRDNANAAHAFAHVLHESGASDEAHTFLASWLPGYDRGAVLHGHIAWHAALNALERGDVQTALDCYARHVSPSVSAGTPVNVVSDSASFLWRLDAYGHNAPRDCWQEAFEYASNHFQTPGFAFADIHMAMIAAATGDSTAVQRRAQTLEDLARESSLPAGSVVPAICRALQAFAENDYSACARILEDAGHETVRIGGSGAQREIIEDTLLLSWLKSGEVAKARSLLDGRLHRRPSRRDARWLEGLGTV